VASQALRPAFRQGRILSFAGARWPELLAVIVAVETALATLLCSRYGYQHIPWTDYYLLWLIPAGLVSLIICLTWLWRLHRAGEEHPISATMAKLRAVPPRSYIELLVPILVMAPFLASYTTFKVVLVDIRGPTVDPILARLDGILGFQPWQVSHAIIGPLGTMVLDRLYYLWFFVNQAMLIGVLFVPILVRQRAQVLVTFVLVWIVLGSLFAALLPSVGPCYYGKLYPVDAYADLMGQLKLIAQSHPLTTLGVQDALWFNHLHDQLGLGSGVSAMPSMHVAVATITALLLRRIGLALLGWFWVSAIWIGSFHLGWHYASDGIVSFLVTVTIWKAVAVMLAAPETGEPQVAAAARA
jgi:hypothetical protein